MFIHNNKFKNWNAILITATCFFWVFYYNAEKVLYLFWLLHLLYFLYFIYVLKN